MSGVVQTQTGSQTIASGQVPVFSIGYGYYPNEGSRCVTTMYNWTAQATYVEDVSQLQERGVLTILQSVYIDNSTNTQGVQIIVNGTGQVINCPASSQGIFPLFLPENATFSISSVLAGVPTPIAATTRCYFVNCPVSPAVWHI
jgi:hypothetical protein